MKNVCIVGAGLAGGIIASGLDKNKYNITLIEQGDIPEPYEGADEKWLSDTPKAVFTRGSGVGGTTNYWHGGLTALDCIDVEKITTQFNEQKLPFSYDYLSQYYNKAIRYLTGGIFSDTKLVFDNDVEGFFLDETQFTYKGVIYPNKTFSTKSIIENEIDKGNVKLIRNTCVKRIVFNNDGETAVSVECVNRQGKRSSIPADIIVVAAGGLGSPKVLLNTINEHNSLGDLPVGRYIIDHPSGFVFKAKLKKRTNLKNLFGKRSRGARIQYGFIRNSTCLLDADRNHILFLRPAFSMKDPATYDFLKRKLIGYKGKRLGLKDFIYLIRNFDLLLEALNFKFGILSKVRYVSGLVFLEQNPTTNNYIRASANPDFEINWSISDDDCDSLRDFLAIYFESHGNMFETYRIFDNLKERLDTASHHSGGCRMADNKENGVVDNEFKVFSTNNLYVVDGSVLGYSGYANTGLTISAMALMFVDKLNLK